MITPAQRRREFVLAQKKAGDAAPALSPHANAYELMLARLDADRRRLKLLQSVERKAEAKRAMLPDYEAWVAGALAADKGGQDDVVVSIMVWRIDVGDYAVALDIAGYVLKHGLTLPDQYKRTAGCLIAEEIADAALKALASGNGFDLAVLNRAQDITAGEDMPDEVRAKLMKANALSLEAGGHLQVALQGLRRALELNDKVGVKKDIERVERALKHQGSEVGDQGSKPKR